jgi:uncharacterized protein YbbC (DUF1343 family)/CubicO group peptidase (beta-lactamase class C family)
MRTIAIALLLVTAGLDLSEGAGLKLSVSAGLKPGLRATPVLRRAGFSPASADAVIERAIADRRIPGGVFHFEQNGAVYEKAYGNRAIEPRVEAMTADTIFDMASLTKVMATTPAIWLLIQRGRIELDAPVRRYLPEFSGGWRDEVTIRHLLTHTSGLRPDLDLTPTWSGYETGIKLALAEAPRNRPGFVFRYSDINFELLGEIVRRVSGKPLDQFVQRAIYTKLKMRDTRFLPHSTRIAPTEYDEHHVMLHGVVHDPTARNMGGVAGHAGLFSTAHDVALYARMLLRGGAPIFKREIVNMLTAVQSPPNVAMKRTGGFDYDTGFSRPRGDFYPIGSFGHTGFTGTMLWIDPQSNSFYVFLSNRVHPDGKGNVLKLQRDLGTIAGRAAGYTTPVPRRIDWITMGGDAVNGIDVLVSQFIPSAARDLRSNRDDVAASSDAAPKIPRSARDWGRIGLITNQTGIDRSGNPTIDLLRSAPGIDLRALFSPEHGIRGTEDEKVSDTRDAASGLPIYSLYGETRKPARAQLEGIDTLVFDIQDVGARFYTYIATMELAMEAAADAHIRFVVLDRVNPIGGSVVNGPLLQGATSFIAAYPIVVEHGMTVGELAQMIRAEKNLDLDLVVVPLRGWKRGQWQDEAGLPWINPSPNMRSLAEAGLYPGVALVETAISVGRGTSTPFELVGAPWIDGETFAREMNALGLQGVHFEPARFTPSASHFANEACGGVRITLTDRSGLRAASVGLAIIHTLHRLYPNELDLDKVNELLRDPRTVAMIREGKTIDEIEALWRQDESEFEKRRASFLMYH